MPRSLVIVGACWAVGLAAGLVTRVPGAELDVTVLPAGQGTNSIDVIAVIRNRRGETVAISRVESTCECVTIAGSITTFVLGPGDEARISARVHTPVPRNVVPGIRIFVGTDPDGLLIPLTLQ